MLVHIHGAFRDLDFKPSDILYIVFENLTRDEECKNSYKEHENV